MVAGLTPWTLTRTDDNTVHTFTYNPNVLPAMEYDQEMTEHKLLSGDIKYDKSTKKVKVLHVVWGQSNLMGREEREKLEDWMDLNCKLILGWYDHDNWPHNDKGYMIPDSVRPVYLVGYTFGFRLRLVEEA